MFSRRGRPALRPMQQTKDLDFGRVFSDAVHSQEGRARDYQLAGATLAAGASCLRKVGQPVDGGLNAIALLDGGPDIIRGNERKLRVAVGNRSRQPSHQQEGYSAADRFESSSF